MGSLVEGTVGKVRMIERSGRKGRKRLKEVSNMPGKLINAMLGVSLSNDRYIAFSRADQICE